MIPCEVDDCTSPCRGGRTWCEAHIWRIEKYGSPLAHIPLGRMRNGVPIGWRPEIDPQEEHRVAYAPAPAVGRGLLWLV